MSNLAPEVISELDQARARFAADLDRMTDALRAIAHNQDRSIAVSQFTVFLRDAEQEWPRFQLAAVLAEAVLRLVDSDAA